MFTASGSFTGIRHPFAAFSLMCMDKVHERCHIFLFCHSCLDVSEHHTLMHSQDRNES